MGAFAKSLFKKPSRVSGELLDTVLPTYPRRDFQVRLFGTESLG